MSAYIKGLMATVKADQAKREDQMRVNVAAARERLTPLETRMARLLDTIPPEIQREGLSLPSLQASLKGRHRGSCHPGELGVALRKLGFSRRRNWRGDSGFMALWFPAP